MKYSALLFSLTALLAAKFALAAEEIEGVAAAAEAAQESGGMPQLDVATYPSQLFWLFITCFLTYVFLAKSAIPKIGGVLEFRQQQKQTDIERAGELGKEAEDIKTAYEDALAKAHEEAQSVLVETEKDLSEIAAKRNLEFADDARKRLTKAETSIKKAKDKALNDIVEVAAEIAVEASGKIANISVKADTAKKAVETSMKEAS